MLCLISLPPYGNTHQFTGVVEWLILMYLWFTFGIGRAQKLAWSNCFWGRKSFECEIYRSCAALANASVVCDVPYPTYGYKLSHMRAATRKTNSHIMRFKIDRVHPTFCTSFYECLSGVHFSYGRRTPHYTTHCSIYFIFVFNRKTMNNCTTFTAFLNTDITYATSPYGVMASAAYEHCQGALLSSWQRVCGTIPTYYNYTNISATHTI